jgi:hypothetical protein
MVVLALGACVGFDQTPNVVVDDASALSHWGMDTTIWWHPTPDVQMYFGPSGGDGDCHTLSGDVRAFLNGAPVGIDPGGVITDPDTGHPECSGPTVGFPLPATPISDAPFDLVISDSTAEVHVDLVNVLAPRSVTLDGGGSLVPGTTATVRWAPSTDDLEPPVRYNDISLDCTPPIFPTLHTDDYTLTKSGNAFSFAVPPTNGSHYTLSCYLDLVPYATISRCDFGSCRVVLQFGGGFDFPFTLTI